jgi:tight adherence protein C
MNGTVLGLLSVLLASAALACSWIAWRRFRLAQPAPAAPGDPAPPSSLWRVIVSPLARALRPTGKDLDRLTLRLQVAGLHGRGEIDRFLETKVASLLVCSACGIGLMLLKGGAVGMFLMLAGVVVGIVLPGVSVDGKATKRRDEIAAQLPGATDLLMTCVDAGLSIEQALGRVAREIRRASPVLAAELGLTASECEAGVPLAEALRRLARRCDVDDLTGLCIVITQSYELGSPIVQTLAEYADAARRERMAMLEERAGKLAVKLIFPLAVFLLPSALVSMLGPAAIQVIGAMRP